MTTLATMKTRIADEIARSDLTSNIASAITTAIEAYQSERLYFNVARSITFPTVASQEFYDSSDNAYIPNLLEIDFVYRYKSGETRRLTRIDPDDAEDLSNNGSQTGEPCEYSYYDRRIRLYPIPSSTAWTIRIGAHYNVAAPATDSEASNPWMVEAERLVRSRAKYELAVHVTRDSELAAMMAAAISEAWGQLKISTNSRTGRGEMTATQF